MPCTYPLAGCRIAQTYNILSRLFMRDQMQQMRGGMERTYALRASLHPQWHTGSRPRNVDLNLVPYLLIETFSVPCKGKFN